MTAATMRRMTRMQHCCFRALSWYPAPAIRSASPFSVYAIARVTWSSICRRQQSRNSSRWPDRVRRAHGADGAGEVRYLVEVLLLYVYEVRQVEEELLDVADGSFEGEDGVVSLLNRVDQLGHVVLLHRLHQRLV